MHISKKNEENYTKILAVIISGWGSKCFSFIDFPNILRKAYYLNNQKM